MSGPLLAPYNDSMRLGQGFNSFLHTPCVYNAVDVDINALVTEKPQDDVSQVVSYSSRLVTSISEVVTAMNISAPSSIKNGSIVLSGNTQSVDTFKFHESDVNVVVSVKVINQTTKLKETSTFKPIKRDFKNKSSEFQKLYGDSYISGYIEGGEFHGLVSIKALDTANSEEVKSKMKSRLNNSGGGGLILGSGSANQYSLSNDFKDTEITISVNWSGGGQIKELNTPWSLDSVIAAAAAFPSNVASCPHHTWAILTRYDANPSFLEYAATNSIAIPYYATAQLYASDLLDMYMEYKNNLLRISDIMAHPDKFVKNDEAGRDAVETDIESLIAERAKMKKQMDEIVKRIDTLNEDPSRLADIEGGEEVDAPEISALNLPVLKKST